MNRKNRNRDFYTHNCLNILCNGISNTHNIRHDLWKCATAQHKFLQRLLSAGWASAHNGG